MLEHVKVVIDDDELLVGKPSCRDLDAGEAEQWALIQQYSQPAKPSSRGQSSHMAVDFELLLEKGALNIIDDIKSRMEKLDVADPEQVRKHEFYRSSVIALEGLIAFADRYAAHAKALAEFCADETRKQELLTIANICAKVPAKPAEGFYEAIQSAHFLNFILTNRIPGGPYQLGRLDRFLYKYYKKDIDSGAITKAFAQELLDCLGIIFNEYWPNGSSIGYMVGGRNENGNNVENELTHMCIQSVDHVGV